MYLFFSLTWRQRRGRLIRKETYSLPLCLWRDMTGDSPVEKKRMNELKKLEGCWSDLYDDDGDLVLAFIMTFLRREFEVKKNSLCVPHDIRCKASVHWHWQRWSCISKTSSLLFLTWITMISRVFSSSKNRENDKSHPSWEWYGQTILRVNVCGSLPDYVCIILPAWLLLHGFLNSWWKWWRWWCAHSFSCWICIIMMCDHRPVSEERKEWNMRDHHEGMMVLFMTSFLILVKAFESIHLKKKMRAMFVWNKEGMGRYRLGRER